MSKSFWTECVHCAGMSLVEFRKCVDCGDIWLTPSTSFHVKCYACRPVPQVTLDEINEKLQEYERKYDVDSERFYELWKAGEAPIDGIDKLRWVAFRESRQHLTETRRA